MSSLLGRPSVHLLIQELEELRLWMRENGVYHVKAGDLELHLEPEEAEIPQAAPRPVYNSAYDDPDLYRAVGGPPTESPSPKREDTPMTSE